jgi:hypothetical protein
LRFQETRARFLDSPKLELQQAGFVLAMHVFWANSLHLIEPCILMPKNRAARVIAGWPFHSAVAKNIPEQEVVVTFVDVAGRIKSSDAA